MKVRLSNLNYPRKISSILLVCVIVATSFAVILPLSSPSVQAISRLGSAGAEDNNPLYDNDMTINVVEWHTGEDHVIDSMMGTYVVENYMTVIIPPLGSNTLTFTSPGDRIDVDGTFITQGNGSPFTKATTITGTEPTGWSGIYFHDGSSGAINDIVLDNSLNGIVFEPGSNLISPGIYDSNFENYKAHAVQIDGALGYTNMDFVIFDNAATPQGTAMVVENGMFNITSTTFVSHGTNDPSLHIKNATVYVGEGQFYGTSILGNSVFIEEQSNQTVLNDCDFDTGASNEYYIRVDGSSPLIDNCSFVTSSGQLSVIANENALGVPAQVRVRQPTADGNPGLFDDSFDNTTLKATGSSYIDLQWYLNVYVRDPVGNPVVNAPVWVIDRNGDPTQPPVQQTQGDGWARWFTVTELTLYESSTDYFNPFNVSAENNSMIGYAIPEPDIIMSNEATVIVPFNPIPNPPPLVSWITTPPGVQSGLITIDYILEDPNPSDDGNLSVEVYYSPDGITWRPAAVGPGGDPTINLNNNTVYSFVWDSSLNLSGEYDDTVYLMIVPYDRAGPGTPGQTGTFIVDNKPPELVSGPFVTVADKTATIEWTVSEPSNAEVQYGLNPSLANTQSNNSGTTFQSVTLTGLNPGRNYTYRISSSDPYGNTFTYMVLTFETEIHIQLYKGWNMISLAPNPTNTEVNYQLSSIAGQYDAVQIYEPMDITDPWKHYVPGKSMGNDLTDLPPDLGIWIKMKNDAVLKVNHVIPPSGGPDMEIFLSYGWNFLAYPSVTTRTVNQALTGFVWDEVQLYDAATDTWYFNDGPGGDADTLTQMEVGRGYWIHCPVQAGGTWTISYI